MGGLGYLMLLKLLRSKSNKRGCNDQVVTNNKRKICNDIPNKEAKNKNLVCRVCLMYGDIPICGTNGTGDISELFHTFANIEINRDDTLPKYLCQGCNSLLQGAILFRNKAQESDKKLRQTSFTNLNDDDNSIDNNEYLHPEPTRKIGAHSRRVGDTSPDPKELTKSPQNTVFSCKDCDSSFTTIKEFYKHKIKHDQEYEQKICPICKKRFKTVSSLKRHIDLHNQETRYMCDKCGKEFAVKTYFDRHLAIHTFDLPFKCSLCPYRGRFKESLNGHMFTHTGEKPYQCTQCPFRCVSKSNLIKHEVVHKKDHDFKCESCGKGFHTKRNLEMHLKVDHTGLKEHICDICGLEFGYRKQLMKHTLGVHKREKLRSGKLPLYLQVEMQEKTNEI